MQSDTMTDGTERHKVFLEKWLGGKPGSSRSLESGKLFEQQINDSVAQSMADPKVSQIRVVKNIGRNDPCPCGSGKKFKKCHAIVKGD